MSLPSLSLHEVGQPVEAIRIPSLPDDRTHVQLHGPDAGLPLSTDILSVGLEESERIPQLFLGSSRSDVDLVAQHQNRHVGQFFRGKEGVQLGSGLGESFPVGGVDHEDDAVHAGRKVLPPQLTRCVTCHDNVLYKRQIEVGVSLPVSCPPRSKVSNFKFPTMSSSWSEKQKRKKRVKVTKLPF